MSLIINDSGFSVPVEGAIVRIDAYSVSRGADVILKREDSTFEDVLDVDGNPTYYAPTEESAERVKIQTETLGKILKWKKSYNINLDLQYVHPETKEVYRREQIAINGIDADERHERNFYSEMKKMEKFQDAEDND